MRVREQSTKVIFLMPEHSRHEPSLNVPSLELPREKQKNSIMCDRGGVHRGYIQFLLHVGVSLLLSIISGVYGEHSHSLKCKI
jgi:hypothetical protein